MIFAETNSNTFGTKMRKQLVAQVLSSVESEIRRTTDPVRMYMREMGTRRTADAAKAKSTSLANVSKTVLTRCAVLGCRIPGSHHLSARASITIALEAEEARLSDLITGLCWT